MQIFHYNFSMIIIFLEHQLTEMKCCPKLTCDNGYAPIHEAARNASAGVLKVMLEYSKSR